MSQSPLFGLSGAGAVDPSPMWVELVRIQPQSLGSRAGLCSIYDLLALFLESLLVLVLGDSAAVLISRWFWIP